MFYYYNNFLNNSDLKNIKQYLKNTDDFKNNPKCSNTNKSGRLQKWYHINNEYFCPLWKSRYDWWESFEYDDQLLYIQNLVQNKINSMNLTAFINSCLINKYRDGNDYISPHRDSKLSFGNEPVICILSIGQKRILRFTKTESNYKDISYLLY